MHDHAITYHFEAPWENYHLAASLRLLLKPEHNFMSVCSLGLKLCGVSHFLVILQNLKCMLPSCHDSRLATLLDWPKLLSKMYVEAVLFCYV